ncbi:MULTISPECIES: DinI-like family protein [Leclercia]|uniref:DinI-like family protein n=1 Tax=Leclercia pneumoniae TaxID=2815358 RepID=A0ABX8JYK8_9ENTR|nr:MULTISPECIES: DinI-like family protein [Leclercia]QSW33794.1 DinI-like family protein [Leclercia pneumoniae]QWW81280.1 DinI-like family protein [Leclercia pneumoniae]
MKVDLTIDRTKKLPDGALPALQTELSKRLQNEFEDCSVTIRRAGMDGLSVSGGEKDVKTKVEEILQQTWESADDWFY